MSDLYGTNDRSSFEPGPEPGDMNVFLHNLLQHSPATVPGTAAARSSSVCQSAVLGYRGSSSMINSAAASLNFSDPGGFFVSEAKERAEKAFSSAGEGDCDAHTPSMKRGDFLSANKGSDSLETAVNQAQSRSSKRSRSTEVHNLSEKRRRSRINEKLKALQNLIPNSNKTDKASMLDEAIEYLKQLQLQVQMLTMRNGFSLPPNYVPCSLPSMQLPVDFNEGNVLLDTSGGADALSGNQVVMMQNVFGTNNPKVSSQQLVLPLMTNNSSSGTSFGLESSFRSPYGLVNHLASAKDICRDDTLHLPLDVSCSGNNSSSGVPS